MGERDKEEKAIVSLGKSEKIHLKSDYKYVLGVPVVAQWKRIPLGTMRLRGLIPGLAQWVKDLALL